MSSYTYRSQHPRPPTGMDLTVTFSMPADNSAAQDAEALAAFFLSIEAASKATGAAWIRIRCAGVHGELESKIAEALAQVRAKAGPARLTLVVDNT